MTRVGSDETCSGDDSEKGKKTTDDVESELVRELRASLRSIDKIWESRASRVSDSLEKRKSVRKRRSCF